MAFLSDGYIGGEVEVLATIRRRIGEARIHAFGVESAVNRYLLDGMAEEGRGHARYVGPGEDAAEVAEALARDLRSPVLTDVRIDWGGLAVTDVTPARIPDLFAGGSVRVHARYRGAGAAKLRVSGLSSGSPAALEVPLTLTDEAREPALPLTWARSRIAELERAVAVGEDSGRSEAEITRLGLGFSLQTRSTSSVAVSERVVNDTGRAAEAAAVPLPMVHGVSAAAYPGGFAGSSTPEPEPWLGLIDVAALSRLRRRGRRGAGAAA